MVNELTLDTPLALEDVTKDLFLQRLADTEEDRRSVFFSYTERPYPNLSFVHDDPKSTQLADWLTVNYPLEKVREIASQHEMTSFAIAHQMARDLMPDFFDFNFFPHRAIEGELARGIDKEYRTIHYLEKPRNAEQIFDVYKSICDALSEAEQVDQEVGGVTKFTGDMVDTIRAIAAKIPLVPEKVRNLIKRFNSLNHVEMSNNNGNVINLMRYKVGDYTANLALHPRGWVLEVFGLSGSGGYHEDFLQKVKVLEVLARDGDFDEQDFNYAHASMLKRSATPSVDRTLIETGRGAREALDDQIKA